MANLKLVGAVAIKVRPDATGFRKETQAKLTEELKGVEAKVPVNAELDAEKAKGQAKKLEKDLDGKEIHWDVKLDYDSVRAAQKKFDSLFDATKEIKFNMGDQATIDKARQDLLDMAKAAKIKISYNNDEAGIQKVLDKIHAVQREKALIPIEIETSDEKLAEWEAEFQAKLDALKLGKDVDVDVAETVTFKYNDDRAGLEKVIREIEAKIRDIDAITLTVELDRDALVAQRDLLQERADNLPITLKYNEDVAGIRKLIARIDEEIAKVKAVELVTKLDLASLLEAKAKAEAELNNQEITITYEADLASLRAARSRILALLPIEHQLHIKTKLDENSLLEALAKMDALIAAAEASGKKAEIRPAVKPEMNNAAFLKVAAELALLTRRQTVGIFVKLNNAGLLLAAAKLTGLRAAARWSEELGRSLGTLDRNLPIVAAVTLTLTQLSGVLTNLAASAFSLGNDLGAVVRMGGILLPAAMLGLASVMTVLKGVFKDFGAAVNGDSKAIEKLTESGKKAAANIRVVFQDIRETVSKNFWKEASDAMLQFTETALPRVRDGLAGLATSLGGIFAALLRSVSTFAQQNGIEVFFNNLTRGFNVAQTGMASFMNAFLTLASVGSIVFPRMGAAFESFAGRFDAWVQRLALDGTFNRWIDRGIEGLHNLFAAAGSLVKVWSNIGLAAQAAGAMTLQSFAGTMAKLEQITAGANFQRNLSNIFRGAREGSENFKASLKDVGPVMDTFSVTIKKTLALSGSAFGAFAKDVGDILGSLNLERGLTAFLTGIKTMFEQLRPAMAPVSEIIRTFGEILGQVATDSGPLFRNLFEQLAVVLTTAWTALQPFLPALIQIGTSIINVLGPAMSQLAESVIPAFASGLQDIGDGLVPIIKNVADVAVGIAQFVSSLPVPVIAGMVAGVLGLGTAFRTASALIAFASTAMKDFSVSAALAAIRTQLLVPVVGLVLAGLTALTAGLVTDFATQQSNATPYANDYAQALREDAAATKELGSAVRSSEIRTAIKNLFDSGAYDNAQKLGISTKMLTDAIVKGGPALAEVNKITGEAVKKYTDAKNAYDKAGDGVLSYGNKVRDNIPFLKQQADAANAVNDVVKKSAASRATAAEQIRIENEQLRAAGIPLEDNARKYELLNQAMDKVPGSAAVAASATKTLTDSFSSGSAKIDAFRKTFELLVGKDAKQATAETLGAYASGFQDLLERVKPLAGQLQELGDKAYGENGFLNVASGNKAVLEANQALVDMVNNVWLGAKTTYDNAIKAGDNAQVAFQKAHDFINERKGDFEELATVSGLNKDKVMGQWTSIFDHEWELKVSFNGLTEVTAKAQALSNLLGAKFDGQKFLAYLDANPDEAIKAVTGAADDVALRWVNKNFQAQLSLLPKDVQDKLRIAVGLTNDEWTNADFATILSVAKKIPGLAEALVALYNGTHDPDTIQAIIKANTDHISIEQARNELDELKAQREAPVKAKVEVSPEEQAKLDRLQAERDARVIAKAETADANSMFDVTQGKVDKLDQSRPKPFVDADTGTADSKTSNSLKLLKEVGDAKPVPFVDADTGTADSKTSNSLKLLKEVGLQRPNPVVSATDNASGTIQFIKGQLNGLTDRTITITTQWVEAGRNPGLAAAQDGIDFMNGGILKFANGGITRPVHRYAGGGIENHVAQIQRAGGPVRIWAEPETKAEAYIPYAQAKRPRSLRILRQVARDFGYDLTKGGKHYANGGINGGRNTTTNTSANVHIGTMITTDMDAAVRKLDQARRDALAVSGIL